jgi:hypothetical protein
MRLLLREQDCFRAAVRQGARDCLRRHSPNFDIPGLNNKPGNGEGLPGTLAFAHQGVFQFTN